MPTMAVLSFKVSGTALLPGERFFRSRRGQRRGEHRHLGQGAQRVVEVGAAVCRLQTRQHLGAHRPELGARHPRPRSAPPRGTRRRAARAAGRSWRAARPRPVGLAEQLVLVHHHLAAVGFPGSCHGTWRRCRGCPPRPRLDAHAPAAWRATGARRARASPGGSVGSASGPGPGCSGAVRRRGAVALQRSWHPSPEETTSRCRALTRWGALAIRFLYHRGRDPPNGGRRSRRSAWSRPGRRAAGTAAFPARRRPGAPGRWRTRSWLPAPRRRAAPRPGAPDRPRCVGCHSSVPVTAWR